MRAKGSLRGGNRGVRGVGLHHAGEIRAKASLTRGNKGRKVYQRGGNEGERVFSGWEIGAKLARIAQKADLRVGNKGERGAKLHHAGEIRAKAPLNRGEIGAKASQKPEIIPLHSTTGKQVIFMARKLLLSTLFIHITTQKRKIRMAGV